MITIRTRFIRLFRNTSFVLSLGIVIGLAFDQGAPFTKPMVTPALGVMMTLSMIDISPKIFMDFRKLLVPILLSIVLNYGVLGGTIIGLSSLIVQDSELWKGLILVAAVPPAVAIIPYTFHLGGKTNFSVVGTIATYLAAFLITPLICVSLLGANLIDPGRLLITLAELIVAPFIVSQIIRRMAIAPIIQKSSGPIINWIMFIIIYTIIGLNRDILLGQPETLMQVFVVAFVSTFVLTYLTNRISGLFGVDKRDRISYVLMGTRKNIGLAAAITLTFFGAKAAMPSAVIAVFGVMTLIWLTIWVRKWV